MAQTEFDKIEPLLTDTDNRYVLLPIKHDNLFRLFLIQYHILYKYPF